jgi:hypothetical protein
MMLRGESEFTTGFPKVRKRAQQGFEEIICRVRSSLNGRNFASASL